MATLLANDEFGLRSKLACTFCCRLGGESAAKITEPICEHRPLGAWREYRLGCDAYEIMFVG